MQPKGPSVSEQLELLVGFLPEIMEFEAELHSSDTAVQMIHFPEILENSSGSDPRHNAKSLRQEFLLRIKVTQTDATGLSQVRLGGGAAEVHFGSSVGRLIIRKCKILQHITRYVSS